MYPFSFKIPTSYCTSLFSWVDKDSHAFHKILEEENARLVVSGLFPVLNLPGNIGQEERAVWFAGNTLKEVGQHWILHGFERCHGGS